MSDEEYFPNPLEANQSNQTAPPTIDKPTSTPKTSQKRPKKKKAQTTEQNEKKENKKKGRRLI